MCNRHDSGNIQTSVSGFDVTTVGVVSVNMINSYLNYGTKPHAKPLHVHCQPMVYLWYGYNNMANRYTTLGITTIQ